MLLFRPFVSYYAQSASSSLESLRDSVDKCIDSARRTVEIIHEIYRIHSFFRTWYINSNHQEMEAPANFHRWYNTTYVMFAASSLLLYVTRVRTPTQCPPIVKSIEMAVEILEAMDDSVVARKSADIVKQTLKEARGTTIDSVISPSNPQSGMQTPISQTFGNGFMDVVCKMSPRSNLRSGY